MPRPVPEGVAIQAWSAQSDLRGVLDALLGTGLTGEVREPCASVIGAINASGRPVAAVDIPSRDCVPIRGVCSAWPFGRI